MRFAVAAAQRTYLSRIPLAFSAGVEPVGGEGPDGVQLINVTSITPLGENPFKWDIFRSVVCHLS
jgi:hypothetical protein